MVCLGTTLNITVQGDLYDVQNELLVFCSVQTPLPAGPLPLTAQLPPWLLAGVLRGQACSSGQAFPTVLICSVPATRASSSASTA